MARRSLVSPRRRRASALLVVMTMVVLMAMSIASLTSFGTHQRTQASRMRIYQSELTAAEQAVDAMIGQIKFFATSKPRQVGGTLSNFHDAVLDISPPHVNGFELREELTGVESLSGQTLQYETINDPGDEWFGYSILRMQYRVRSFVKEASNVSDRLEHPGVGLERVIRLQQIPLYAYAIFYGNNLELDAGAQIDIVGRVHTNGNFYLTSSSSSRYHKNVTVAGNLYGGYYDPTTGRTMDNSKTIYVAKNQNSTLATGLTNMLSLQGRTNNNGTYEANKWLTSKDITGWQANPAYDPTRIEDCNNPRILVNGTEQTNWTADSARYNGLLRDRSHGISPIRLPIPEAENPRVLIEPSNANDTPSVADVKFANKADIMITGDPATGSYTVTNKAGQNITAQFTYTVSGVTKNVISTSSIYNGREGKTVQMFNLDMGNMMEAGIDVGDGIVYINPTQPTGTNANTRQAAVRIVNAANVPTNVQGALTIATAAPLYTKGNVNTDQSAILLLAGDSVNPLSANFNDTKYQNSTQAASPQQAAPTTTNAIFMTGNVPSSKLPGRYGGGAENYFRYLEVWGTAAPHTFNGSLLNLYESKVATGPWDQNASPGQQTTNYYGAPRRIWSWDPDLAGIVPPPGMPSFLEFQMLEWKVVSEDQAQAG